MAMDELYAQPGMTWNPKPMTAVVFDEHGWRPVGGTLIDDIDKDVRKSYDIKAMHNRMADQEMKNKHKRVMDGIYYEENFIDKLLNFWSLFS